MIDVAFNANRAGYGSALAVLLAVVTLALSALVLKVFGESDD
jgi:ABC-type sugar transport system permease subunit